MHDHLEKGDGGDADILEVVRISFPRLCITDGFLLGDIVGVEGILLGIDELDFIVELCFVGQVRLNSKVMMGCVCCMLSLPQLVKALSMMLASVKILWSKLDV